MSDRHYKDRYHGYGIGIYAPDYRVIANDSIGSFHAIRDVTPNHNYKNNMPLFGTWLIGFVGEKKTYHQIEIHGLKPYQVVLANGIWYRTAPNFREIVAIMPNKCNLTVGAICGTDECLALGQCAGWHKAHTQMIDAGAGGDWAGIPTPTAEEIGYDR